MLAIFLSLLMLAGCSSKTEPSSAPVPETPAAAETQPEQKPETPAPEAEVEEESEPDEVPVVTESPFISDEEVSNVIDFVKSQVEDVEYSENVISEIDKKLKDISAKLKEKIKGADIWSEVLGSDHCPVVLELEI